MTSEFPTAFEDLFSPPAVAYVATIGPRGEPQVSPVLFIWDGAFLRFSMNAIRQKRRNLERDPRIALSITNPGNPFRNVEIRGRVLRIEADTDYAFHRHLSQQYFNQDGKEALLPGEERVVVVVQPDRYFPFGETPPESSPESS